MNSNARVLEHARRGQVRDRNLDKIEEQVSNMGSIKREHDLSNISDRHISKTHSKESVLVQNTNTLLDNKHILKNKVIVKNNYNAFNQNDSSQNSLSMT